MLGRLITVRASGVRKTMNFVSGQSRGTRKLMNAGDVVIIYERFDTISYIKLEAYGYFENKYGMFYHNHFIGKPFGIKIYSKTKSGWLYALEPTPELWSLAMNTRTQIVDDSDASFVTMTLDVFPGAKVVESGTGSGNMTLSLARAVGPKGHVYSYEYNQSRATEATSEFEILKAADRITVTCTDVCAEGPDPSTEQYTHLPFEQQFGFIGRPSDSIDAVFLDLPEPWKALPHAYRILKSGRNICCYSPCMEQVNKTCAKLREMNFHSIRMVEVRQRPFEGRSISFPTPDLGRKEDQNLSPSVDVKESPDQASTEELSPLDDPTTDETMEQEGSKDEKLSISAGKRKRNTYEPRVLPPKEYIVSRAMTPMKGHTAFLTFAVCPDKEIQALSSSCSRSTPCDESPKLSSEGYSAS